MRTSLPLDKVKRLVGKNFSGAYYHWSKKSHLDFAVADSRPGGLLVSVGDNNGSWKYQVRFSCSQALVSECGIREVYVDYDPHIFSVVNIHNLRCPATWYYIVRRTLEGSGEKWGMECFKKVS